MSGNSFPPPLDEWMLYYQQANYNEFEEPFGGNNLPDATTTTTVPTTDVFSGEAARFNSHDHQPQPVRTCASTVSHDTIQAMSPEISSSGSGDLSPKTVAKPAKSRRSRASKRTPTTLLNANITNFRSLVQQYTGCHSSDDALALRNHRGPINLCFGSSSGGHNTDYGQVHPYGQEQYQDQHGQRFHEFYDREQR